MMKTTTVKETFRQVYGDVVMPLSPSEAPIAHERSLQWKGERMPLKEAADLFALFVDGYNSFEPIELKKLAEMFEGIEATPGREYSPVVYLHIPKHLRDDVEMVVEKTWKADEINWREDDSLRVWWD